MWSFDLRLPWYLIYMNPYFGSQSIMTLSHARGDTGYGGLYMEVVSRSTRNWSALVRGNSIQLISNDGFRKPLIKVWTLELFSNGSLMNHHYKDWARDEYENWIWQVSIFIIIFGMQVDQRTELPGNSPLKGILVIPPKFHIFRVDMIRC